ncbi:MAG: aminotransferase class V-fold PLP-dependent enzyme [Clostridia bacterium]|nr:aminotransferase class V-fold PLP-dependent enzyme [Clostridia bacterium]
MKEKRQIYADHAATTKVSGAVMEAMQPYFAEQAGNPSSLYAYGRMAARAVGGARRRIKAALHGENGEVYFTSGGSEADNWAIKGTALAYLEKHGHPGHIITTAIEHHAVLHAMQVMERIGFSVTYISPHEDGIVRTEEILGAVRGDTCRISVMLANNEIGTIQPIRTITEAAGCRIPHKMVAAIRMMPYSTASRRL